MAPVIFSNLNARHHVYSGPFTSAIAYELLLMSLLWYHLIATSRTSPSFHVPLRRLFKPAKTPCYDSDSTISYSTNYLRLYDTSFHFSMNPLFDTPRKRSGLHDDDFLMMDMCESSGIMTAIQCLIQPKKPVTDLGRGGGWARRRWSIWIVLIFLGLREYTDLILARPLG